MLIEILTGLILATLVLILISVLIFVLLTALVASGFTVNPLVRILEKIHHFILYRILINGFSLAVMLALIWNPKTWKELKEFIENGFEFPEITQLKNRGNK